tara:strand:+ start:136 stop:351 length:216 start_codon:yes stop_codon:yes gene_type:complete
MTDNTDAQLRELSRKVADLDSVTKEILVHIEYLKKAEEKRSKNVTTVLMFAIGTIVTSVVTWIITGGVRIE